MLAGELVEAISSGNSVSMARALAAVPAADKLRRRAICLRADDDIDPWRAAGDFLALGLRDTAGNGDGDIPALSRRVPSSS